jgi:hypothetical protein
MQALAQLGMLAAASVVFGALWIGFLLLAEWAGDWFL